ncbi:hypothetical protein [Methanobrevibacter arboriphilus]|uniref:Uncharacterized protein n=1 Tax=Methanobrevibacter arboriphilus TaxID=39441 RepID=A0ACA8R1Y6_METAZ|nr:hypothetical protein [Methanobrevibacter arboriphilus]BBL61536.1 hypothetical protein MarbSA_05760 [Methanobrevibacter arboriphilus]
MSPEELNELKLLLDEGNTDKAIGKCLDYSEGTIQRNRLNIFKIKRYKNRKEELKHETIRT